MSRGLAWVCASRLRQAALLVLVSSAIFLPGLGSTGFSMSEGHRVIPAWEMLADARAGEPHWLVPRMFETAYLRKPPGVLWAIAASSALFGETEFAARLPSALGAILLGLAVWHFATRWFGSPWGLAAGLSQVLLPVTWPSARSAEIESLHMLTTGLSCLLLIDWFARMPRTRQGHWARASVLCVSLLAMLLTKGPSGVPFLGGTLVGSLLVFRAGRETARGLLLPMLLAIGAAALVGRLLTEPSLGAEPAVRQGVGAFLWERDKLLRILLISPTILVTMLPVSLALLFPWGPDAAREREGEKGMRPGTTARVLAFAALGSLVIFEVAGVSNERYGLPLCALLTPLVAYVARGASGAFIGSRPAIAQAMFLRRPWGWPIVLGLGAVVFVGLLEPEQRASSGREAGIALAAYLPDGAEVWADEMIEARPEVLLYAVREAAQQGRAVRVRWLKPSFMPNEYPDGLLLLVREDALADERARFTAARGFGPLTEIARGEVHKYTFVLYRVEGGKAK